YRLVVTGRTKHFISAFGEHVIGEEVDYCIRVAAAELQIGVTEFTVAPCVSQDDQKSYHEWYIEFDPIPAAIDALAQRMNELLCQRNVYYNDLIKGSILAPLQIRVVRKGGFIDYMRSVGKLGGQNKVPRLSNDRKLADALTSFVVSH
ncbi:MAG: GH3 auxin-responsive promoter family protein, partial [Flavobacteriales bacterium]